MLEAAENMEPNAGIMSSFFFVVVGPLRLDFAKFSGHHMSLFPILVSAANLVVVADSCGTDELNQRLVLNAQEMQLKGILICAAARLSRWTPLVRSCGVLEHAVWRAMHVRSFTRFVSNIIFGYG